MTLCRNGFRRNDLDARSLSFSEKPRTRLRLTVVATVIDVVVVVIATRTTLMLTGRVLTLMSFTTGPGTDSVVHVLLLVHATGRVGRCRRGHSGRHRRHQLFRSRSDQRKLILFDRFLQPIAQIFFGKSGEQFLLSLLILRDAHLRLEIARFNIPERGQRKLADGRCETPIEGLLRQAGHFVRIGVVVDQLAGEGVDDFHLRAADHPVDAEVGRFGLVPGLGRCHQRQSWFV